MLLPAQAFFLFQFCVMFKNIYFVEQQRTATSDIIQVKERERERERERKRGRDRQRQRDRKRERQTERERERERADFILDTRQPVRDLYENRSCTIISEVLGILL